MAAIAYALIYRADCIYDPLSEDAKNNLYTWLNQANHREAHHCNWKFFRVMVNVAFIKLELQHNQEKMDEYLTDLNSFYIGNGWYSDGTVGHTHKDYYRNYYNNFPFHNP